MIEFLTHKGTLNRYIVLRVVQSLTLAFAVVTGIIMLVDFVEGSRNLSGDTDISSLELSLLTLLKAPTLIEQTIPFVVLFGVMGALYGLNKRSELIVMRASGLSAWRFLRPVIIVTCSFGIIWTLFLNPLASRLMGKYADLQSNFSGRSTSQSNEIWLREGTLFSQTVIRADRFDPQTNSLVNATFYNLDLDGLGGTSYSRRFDAEKAQLVPGGYWQLENVIENAPGQIKQERDIVSFPSLTTKEQLQSLGDNMISLPFWALPSAIEKNNRAGFSSLSLKLQFNKLLALPFMLIAMTFIAAGVSMELTRQGGTLKLLIMGAIFGFGVYFTDSMLTAFGEVGMIPVILAAWATPIMVLLLGISYLAKIEDG